MRAARLARPGTGGYDLVLMHTSPGARLPTMARFRGKMLREDG